MGKLNNAALFLLIVSYAGHFRTATIFHHKPDEVGKKLKVRAVDDGTTLTLRDNKARVAHMG